MKNIYIFIGTTAELIKIAPVIKELKRREIDFTLIETGQNQIHYEELSELTAGLLKADISLGKKPIRSSILFFLIWSIKTFLVGLFTLKKHFKGRGRKAVVLVHGDTVSSLIGSILTKIYGLNLAHVESGLRSFSFLEPFPEEICRFLISHIADIHFCPNSWAVKNLLDKNSVKINTEQNTLIESLQTAVKKKEKETDSEIKSLQNKNYFVLVMHRQEHIIFRKNRTKDLLIHIIKSVPDDLYCVFIMHELSRGFLEGLDSEVQSYIRNKVILIPRLAYMNFMKLLYNAEFILTDGGSNQEESYYMGKPCLLLRNKTERIEGLGKNVVLSKYDKDITKEFIMNYKEYHGEEIFTKRLDVKPSKRIVEILNM